MNVPPNIPSPDWEGIQELARILRGPQGCPWDRAQTPAGLAAHLVEEAFEVLHAAEWADARALGEELGDTLFLLALVQSAAEETGCSGFPEIERRAVAKLTARHPHVFDEPRELELGELRVLWEKRKREEHADAAGEDAAAEGEDAEAIRLPAPALPALLQAFRIQERAAAFGFDWPTAEDVLPKVEEEIGELREALAAEGHGGAHVREELGDLLFAVVNLSRMLRIDPESALREATTKFRGRFNRMAVRAATEGQGIEKLSLAKMDEHWNAVKAEERNFMKAEDRADPEVTP